MRQLVPSADNAYDCVAEYGGQTRICAIVDGKVQASIPVSGDIVQLYRSDTATVAVVYMLTTPNESMYTYSVYRISYAENMLHPLLEGLPFYDSADNAAFTGACQVEGNAILFVRDVPTQEERTDGRGNVVQRQWYLLRDDIVTVLYAADKYTVCLGFTEDETLLFYAMLEHEIFKYSFREATVVQTFHAPNPIAFPFSFLLGGPNRVTAAISPDKKKLLLYTLNGNVPTGCDWALHIVSLSDGRSHKWNLNYNGEALIDGWRFLERVENFAWA